MRLDQSVEFTTKLGSEGNNSVNVFRFLEEKYGLSFGGQRGGSSLAAAFLGHTERHDSSSESDEAQDDDDLAAVVIGTDGENGGADGNSGSAGNGEQRKSANKKKRKPAPEKYDSTDPFIDDAEDVAENVSRATRDGFFVYAGPLIQGSGNEVER